MRPSSTASQMAAPQLPGASLDGSETTSCTRNSSGTWASGPAPARPAGRRWRRRRARLLSCADASGPNCRVGGGADRGTADAHERWRGDMHGAYPVTVRDRRKTLHGSAGQAAGCPGLRVAQLRVSSGTAGANASPGPDRRAPGRACGQINRTCTHNERTRHDSTAAPNERRDCAPLRRSLIAVRESPRRRGLGRTGDGAVAHFAAALPRLEDGLADS
jgi:hypothetical protein